MSKLAWTEITEPSICYTKSATVADLTTQGTRRGAPHHHYINIIGLSRRHIEEVSLKMITNETGRIGSDFVNILNATTSGANREMSMASMCGKYYD